MMVEAEIMGALAQFGVAGLIGWMWLSERRGAQERERQIAEAHAEIWRERQSLASLIRLVEQNTRALAGVQRQQHELSGAIERLVRTLDQVRRDSRRHGGAGVS